MTENKYQIAQEAFQEWKDFLLENPGVNFDEYLKDKVKPKDEMFEKFKRGWECYKLCEVGFAYKQIKGDIFGPDLNGTRGLDYGKLKKKFIEFMATFNVRGQSMPNTTIINLSNWLVDLVEGEIKSRLEGRE